MDGEGQVELGSFSHREPHVVFEQGNDMIKASGDGRLFGLCKERLAMGRGWEALVTAWYKVRRIWCGGQIHFGRWGFLKAAILRFRSELG